MSSKNQLLDKDTRRALQELARHQLIKKMLADIATDMQVCKLEGWDISEYPLMLKNEIELIINSMEKKK